MMPEPGDDRAGRPAGRGRLRASHADREQAIDTLKDAFVQGRLTKDELDSRVGDVLASRTYADLAALTADLPAGPVTARPPHRPRHARPRQPANTTIKRSARVLAAATALTVALWAGALLSNTNSEVVAVLVVAATFVWFGIVLVTGSVMLESKLQQHSRGQLPPGPGQGGQGSKRAISEDPPGPLRPGDPGWRHDAEASRSPLSRPRLTGYAGHLTPATAALG
jgi:hypothetical protein